MNKKLLPLPLLVISACLTASGEARAQYGGAQSGGGIAGLGMGTFTQGMGQSTQSNGAFGSRTLGGSSIGTPSRTAMGSAGGGMMGSGMGQGNGMGQGFGLGNQTNSSQITGNEWFVPGNRKAGQFVGSDSQDARNFIGAFSQLTGMNQNGRNGQFGQNGQFGRNGRQNQNQNQQNRNGRNGRQQDRSPMLRTYLADFRNLPPVSSPNLGQRLAKQLSTSTKVKAIGPVQVTLAGRIAVLQGTVATEQDRDLAGRIAMLEPGVSQVRNELQIESELPPPAPASGSAGSAGPQVNPSLGQ